jgi:CHAD domain-containing protein
VLRAVTSDRPIARVLLSGDALAVREMALAIATAMPACLPLASLPALGIAQATGLPPAPRRLGPPQLGPSITSLSAALAHIMGHLLDVVLHFAARLDHGPEAVHQMRVAVRRARSAVSMFQSCFAADALAPMRDPLRLLNAHFGPTRDWDVFTSQTLPIIADAVGDDDRLGRLMAAAQRQRDTHHRDLDAWLNSAAFRLLVVDLAWFIAAGPWRPPRPSPIAPPTDTALMEVHAQTDDEPAAPAPSMPDLRGFAATVLQRRWRQLTAAGRDIEESDIPALHDLRLRAKRARYAAEMFLALYPGKAPQKFIRRLADLQDCLGVLNDGAVATHLLQALGGPGGRHGYAAGLVTGFIVSRTAGIRPRIVESYKKFQRQDPYWG